MKIHIKGTNLEVTPALQEYVEERAGALAVHVSRWEEGGGLQLWVEIARTTNHHKKGDVFLAKFDLGLPGETLRVEETKDDARAAIDCAKDTMQRGIKKYKETHGA